MLEEEEMEAGMDSSEGTYCCYWSLELSGVVVVHVCVFWGWCWIAVSCSNLEQVSSLTFSGPHPSLRGQSNVILFIYVNNEVCIFFFFCRLKSGPHPC
jgi:hypothetical protein